MNDQHREHPLPWAADGANPPAAESADAPSPENNGQARDPHEQPREPQGDAASGGPDGEDVQGEAQGEGATGAPQDDAPAAAPQGDAPFGAPQDDSSSGDPAFGAPYGGPVPGAQPAGGNGFAVGEFSLPKYEDLFAIPASEPQPTPAPPQPEGAEPQEAGDSEQSAGEQADTLPVQSPIAAALARRPDPRDRPPDPAGTQPKYDPDSLLPKREEPALVSYATEIGEDEEPSDLLPARRAAGGVGAPLPAVASMPVPYAPRFQFIKGALAAMGVVAIAVLVLALTGSTGHGKSIPWSSWKPADNGVDPAIQIANHVAPEYRQNDGKQIVNVTGGPPAYDGQSLVLALLQSGQQPSELTGNAVLYQLCGNGSNCAIKGGTPSAERGLLLRREALELALYTFHYLPGVNEVVVTIPPAKGSKKSSSSSVNRALFFRPSTVSDELSKQKLADTLPQPTPDVSKMNESANAELVQTVTDKALYDFSIVQGNQTYILVLQPPSLGG